jgi:Holliday junction resolvase
MSGRVRGIERERALREFLVELGWMSMRAAGSLGPVDVLAIAGAAAVYPQAMHSLLGSPPQGEVLLVQCKSTSSPYANFGPSSRRQLVDLAVDIGGAAWIAHKPKGATSWAWIHSSGWPT